MILGIKTGPDINKKSSNSRGFFLVARYPDLSNLREDFLILTTFY